MRDQREEIREADTSFLRNIGEKKLRGYKVTVI